ncbi:hypothetical protein A2477_04605 [Candidatus Falkowbacteria bacterium RIFOXYC2_FULL_47_12]|uniref:Uncharacterized protein n=2 Tax=Candidatus Falkowiibacteriota TaxID=1752728 RepID=A0A1F5TMV2_9BACT|nr:MAG: hypothetical protein A2242_02280 [Candidatus Falkowbacteria bacterium RIFOXYA2_FULL_47_9]OGF39811.1 MAG: hypothetical protein A2477_04605 [Candidatus Falkowbacteria bacterium RIFOXYC2_FULL_47_12]
MDYQGVIIAESLEEEDVLKDVKILSTKVEAVTPRHATPYLKQWTLHTVEIPEIQAQAVAEKISRALDSAHNDWYADFKNDTTHFIIFRNKVFKIDRKNQAGYDEAREYGLSLGIPEYQVDLRVRK